MKTKDLMSMTDLDELSNAMAERLVDHAPTLIRLMMENFGFNELMIPYEALDEPKKRTGIIVIPHPQERSLIIRFFDQEKQSLVESAQDLLNLLHQEGRVLAMDILEKPNMPLDILTLAQVEKRLEEGQKRGEYSSTEVSAGLNVVRGMIEERGFIRQEDQVRH